MIPHFIVGGSNDGFKRFEQGLCGLYPCPGHIMLRNMETRSGPCPDWIREECIACGRIPRDAVEVTTYTYRCLECGHEMTSTKVIDKAVMN